MSNSTGIVVLIEVRGKDGREEEAKNALIHAIETSEKPGMLSSRVFEDLRDPGVFFAIQEWDALDSFQAHMGEVRGGMDEATEMLAGPPRAEILRQVHAVTA